MLGLAGLFALLAARGRAAAGAALSALALQPQIVALAIPAIALRALVQRRWRLLSVAVGTGALMVVVPMLFLPGWVSEWLDELVVRRARVAVFLPTAWGFAADVFGSPIIGGLLVAAVAIGCWLLVRGSSPDDVGLFALTLPLSLFATPYAWSYDFLVLFVSYAFVLARAGGASPRARMWLTIGAVALAGPVQWLLYTVAFPRGNETLSAVVTAGTALLGGVLGEFRAAQAAVIAVAAFLPAAAYSAARSLDVSSRYALGAAALVGLGGVFAPGWVAADSFAPAALIGTLFFLAFARAARGSLGAGALAGLAVGLLYLARAEGALFGLALLALALRPASRRAGLAGSAIALAIGGLWFARDVSLGASDLLARSMLLADYQQFFRVAPPTAAQFVGALPDVLVAKISAVVSNAATAFFAFFVLLGPLAAVAAWRSRGRADVRAGSSVLILVFIAQSLLWTLHSTRGSYFHSLAAFFPFGIALAAAAAERSFAPRDAPIGRLWVAGTLALAVALTPRSVVQWHATFNPGARARAVALEAIPD